MTAHSTPTGWQIRPLGELCSIQRGRFSVRPRNDPRFYGGDIPFIQTGDVASSSIYVRSYRQTLNSEGLAVSKLFPRGTLVMTIAANIGDVAILDIDAAFPDSLVGLVPHDEVRSEWLFYALRNSKNNLLALAPANAQANLNIERLEPLRLLVPPLSEQRRIAEVLATWDRAIDAAGLSAAGTASSLDGFLMRLLDRSVNPEQWHTSQLARVRLGEIFRERVETGAANDRLLSVTGSDGVIDRDGVERRDTSSEDKSKYKLVMPGDIAYNTMRMWQGVGGLSSLRGIVSPAYTVITPNRDRINPKFAAYLFKTPRMIHRFHQHSQGLVDDTLSLKYSRFAEIAAAIPTPGEQRRIVAILEELSTEITVRGREVEALRRQRDALAYELLTGRLRTRETERLSAGTS